MNKAPILENYKVAEYNSKLYDLTYKDDDFSSYKSRTLNMIGVPEEDNDKYKKKEEGFPIEFKAKTENNLCGMHDIFDMQCYKEMKIVMWVLIGLALIAVLTLIWYIIRYVIVPNAESARPNIYSRIFDQKNKAS